MGPYRGAVRRAPPPAIMCLLKAWRQRIRLFSVRVCVRRSWIIVQGRRTFRAPRMIDIASGACTALVFSRPRTRAVAAV